MKTLELIEELQKMGYSVTYTKRKDGGYRITRINGVAFSGSTGNTEARRILGVELSARRSRQLQRIRTPKGKWGHQKKKQLPKELKKKLTKLQRKWRKRKPTPKDKGETGAPSTSGVRYTLEHEGLEEAERKLNENERYLEGLAYSKNVEILVARIRREKIGSSVEDKWEELATYIENNKDQFKEDWIQTIYEILGSPPIKFFMSMSEEAKIIAIYNAIDL